MLCSEASESAGEPLAGTAVTAERWLVLEVPGSWPRDIASAETLPPPAQSAVQGWLAGTPGARLQYVRRPGRAPTGTLVFMVEASEAQGSVRRIELSGHDDLASVDLEADGDPVETPLVLVCGHGSRDRCCALRGTAVFGALADRLGDEQFWISSHLGGHRFAANVLVLPAGLQLGRVGVAEAPQLVERALSGRIQLDRYRGRTCYEGATQAAEHAVRARTGLNQVGDLSLRAVEDGVVAFRAADGSDWLVAVDEAAGPTVPASCGDEPAPQRVFHARVLTGGSDGLRAAAGRRDP